jgi:hypothetical protein
MTVCNYPECNNYTRNSKTLRCDDHILRNELERKKEAAFFSKRDRETASRDKNDKAKIARNEKSKKTLRLQGIARDRKAEIVNKYKALWAGWIQDSEDRVNALRATKPQANAGENSGATDIPGGLKNEISLRMSGQTHGATIADVCHSIRGYDSSDKGLFKFRRVSAAGNGKNILIHCR